MRTRARTIRNLARTAATVVRSVRGPRLTKRYAVHPPALPLTNAVLCMDCEAVSGSNQTCSSCGSGSLLSLARILNRRAA